MTDKEIKYKEYKEWVISIYGKLPYKWRQSIILKHFSSLGKIERDKIYHRLWNTYTGHNHNLLYVKYINEICEAHRKGSNYLKI